jgi:hypothetical protein
MFERIFELLGGVISPLELILKDRFSGNKISMEDFIDIGIVYLGLDTKVKELEGDQETIKKLFRETLIYLTKESYTYNGEKMTDDFFTTKYDIQTITNISKEWLYSLKNLSSEISNNIINENGSNTIDEIFLRFKEIETNFSNKNHLEQRLVGFLNSPGGDKYNDLLLKIDGFPEITIGQMKGAGLLTESLFPTEIYNSYFKLASFLLQGIVKKSDIDIENITELKNADVNNFSEMYVTGLLLYLCKLLLVILDGYVVVHQNGIQEDIDSVMNKLTQTTQTFTQKSSDILRMIFKGRTDVNVEEVMATAFYLPTPDKFKEIFNDTPNTFAAIREKAYSLNANGKTYDDILLEHILESDPKTMAPQLMEFNNNIITKLEEYKKTIPEIFNMILVEASSSIFLTQITMFNSFPDSLGTHTVNGLNMYIDMLMNRELFSLENEKTAYNTDINEMTNKLQNVEDNYDEEQVLTRENFLALRDVNDSVLKSYKLNKNIEKTLKIDANDFIQNSSYVGNTLTITTAPGTKIMSELNDIETKINENLTSASKLRSKMIVDVIRRS